VVSLFVFALLQKITMKRNLTIAKHTKSIVEIIRNAMAVLSVTAREGARTVKVVKAWTSSLSVAPVVI
jgi:hypothetical protein